MSRTRIQPRLEMEQTTPPFGDDLFPALQKLSGFLEPYAKPAIVITIALSLPYVLSDSRALIPPQAVVPLQLLAVAYLSGMWELRNIPINFAVEHAEPLQAFYVVWNRVGTYFKVGFLVSLTCYMPIYHGVPLLLQPWLQGLILFIFAVIGFFAPTAKFIGPVRFGYLHHAAHLSSIYRLMLDWWMYAALFLIFSPAVLPSAGLGLGAMSVAAWIHIYREYVGQRTAVAEAVAQHAAMASLAASAAHEDAATAGRYEAQLAAAATTARRDALQAQLVRPTDFFDSATEAWAALATVTQPAEDAANKAQNLLDAANQAAGNEKPDEEVGHTELLGRYLAEAAQATLDEARVVVSKLHTAQEAVARSRNAAAENQKARAAAEKNAEAANKAVKRLAEVTKNWPDMALSAASDAANTQAFADRAFAAATEGEIEKAWELAASAETSANNAKKWMEKLRSELSNGQQVLSLWLEGRT